MWNRERTNFSPAALSPFSSAQNWSGPSLDRHLQLKTVHYNIEHHRTSPPPPNIPLWHYMYIKIPTKKSIYHQLLLV